jgi:hypothetical protein
MIRVIRLDDGSRILTHALASSRRTEGFPVLVVTEAGRIAWEGRTTKRLVRVPLAGAEMYLIHFYESNSALRSVLIYRIPAEGDAVLEEHIREQDLGRVFLYRDFGEARDRMIAWLTHQTPTYPKEA